MVEVGGPNGMYGARVPWPTTLAKPMVGAGLSVASFAEEGVGRALAERGYTSNGLGLSALVAEELEG